MASWDAGRPLMALEPGASFDPLRTVATLIAGAVSRDKLRRAKAVNHEAARNLVGTMAGRLPANPLESLGVARGLLLRHLACMGGRKLVHGASWSS